MVNKDLATALNRYNEENWDSLCLNYAQPSSAHLWRMAKNDAPVANS
jgi:hypothetical protein